MTTSSCGRRSRPATTTLHRLRRRVGQRHALERERPTSRREQPRARDRAARGSRRSTTARCGRARPPTRGPRPQRRASSARERPERPGVQVRLPLEHRETARAPRPTSPELDLHLDRRVVGQQTAAVLAARVRPAVDGRRSRAAHEDVVDRRAGGREPPLGAAQVVQRPRAEVRSVEVAGEDDGIVRLRERVGEPGAAQELGVREALVRRVARRSACSRPRASARPTARVAARGRRAAPFPRRAAQSDRAGATAPARRESDAGSGRASSSATTCSDAPQQDRVALPRERGPQEAVVRRREGAPGEARDRDRPEDRPGRQRVAFAHPGPRAEPPERPGRNLLQADRRPGGRRLRGAASPRGTRSAAGASCCRGRGSRSERARRSTVGPCESCWPTRPRSRRGTTTSWPPPWREPAPTSSSPPRGSGSATLPRRDGYRRDASASTRSRRGSSGAPACGCR